jgi:hypothetical protein
MLILFTITTFLGALLLFLVQPMVGRMLLPLLGGAPAVWNTAMVFYQVTLLAGYTYTHVSTKWLGVKRQTLLHLALLFLPLLVLPIALPHGWTPPTAQNPIPWLFALLAVAVGLPFFVVSAMSPLLQRWFSASGHRDAHDPYFLYAASNCGSLLALICYPVLIEPYLRLSQQSRWWAMGYVVLALLTAICGLWTWRTAQNLAPAAVPVSAKPVELLTPQRRLRWVLLAFVPCSLMLSVTTFITSEVAPIPLLWVIPMGIYLLTFIFAFARRQWVPHVWWIRAIPFAVLPLIMLLVTTMKGESLPSLGWPIGVHFIGLFIIGMVCHGELAKDRPAVAHLTEFYLWISAGGVIGGMFNALLAPVIFPTVIEYPVTLVLACLLMPSRSLGKPSTRTHILDVVLPLALGFVTAGLVVMNEHTAPSSQGMAVMLVYGLPAIFCLCFYRRPVRFALGFLAVLVATMLSLRSAIHTSLIARSFFGVHRVELYPGAEYIHILRHGTTMHGMESIEPKMQRTPLLYYTKAGPLGQMIATLPDELKQEVAAVGLGAGSVACYANVGQHWTFYEIDPEVERIARDPKYFMYLQTCPADVKVVLGDARLSLEAAADGQFGLMILDAYSSDTVPLHLVTREALALYLRKLAPTGVLAFHITNRHLDLEPVFANLARDAGLSALYQEDLVGIEEFTRSGRMQSRWVVMSRDAARLGALAKDPRWRPPQVKDGVKTWTDDYASIFSVFHTE